MRSTLCLFSGTLLFSAAAGCGPTELPDRSQQLSDHALQAYLGYWSSRGLDAERMMGEQTTGLDNAAPVADAGDDVEVQLGHEATLDGSDSLDPDGGPLTYLWTISRAPIDSTLLYITDQGASVARFAPDVEGEYEIRLLVGDGYTTDADHVVLTANDFADPADELDTGDWEDPDTGWESDEDLDGDGWYASDSDFVGDCDDSDADVHPDAEEICDGIDNDCDGTVDIETTDAGTFYADADGDSYGDPGETTTDCFQPAGYASNDSDCDDGDPLINPGADEICSPAGAPDTDNDCDGSVDEGLATTWYADSDGDFYGDPDSSIESCSVPEGYQPDPGDDDSWDCDDSDPTIHPGGIDSPGDGIDQDCDGADAEATVSYADVQAIWTASCDGCHLNGASEGDLALDAGVGAFLGVLSVGAPDVALVAPGTPEDSYLWHKLNGTQSDVGGGGDDMPADGALSEEELEIVEAWIREGASGI